MCGVDGDLFVGEANLFLASPRRQWKLPYRVETSSRRQDEREADATVSFDVHVANANMVLLCDRRLNVAKVSNALCASDIGIDTDVVAHDIDYAGRWTNLRSTSDGRHWSDGEYNWRRMMDFAPRDAQDSNSLLSCLVAQLPPCVARAVREGRSIIISKAMNLLDRPTLGNSKDRDSDEPQLRVRRVCKSFGNYVYALSRQKCDGEDAPTIAVLIVGRFWSEHGLRQDTREENGIDDSARPVLTVARKRPVRGVIGGRVFCIALGGHLTNSLESLDAEGIANTKWHYEGYFGDDKIDALTLKQEIPSRQLSRTCLRKDHHLRKDDA